MELYKGLPHRTIHIETEDKDIVFGVSTEEVGELIYEYYKNSGDYQDWIEEFDNSTSYFVPEEIFLSEDDETVIEYIKENIDALAIN